MHARRQYETDIIGPYILGRGISYLENGIAEINGSSNLVEQQSSPVAMELPTSNIFK